MTAARFFRCRLVKDGPFVPVKIFFGPPLVDGEELDRSPRWQAVVNAEPTGRAATMLGIDDAPVEIDGNTLRRVEPIDEPTYRFMVADAEHARQWRPSHPKASPKKAVDFNTLPPRF